MSQFWLINELILKNLKKFDDLVQEALKLRFFHFKGDEEMKIIIKSNYLWFLIQILDLFDGANGAVKKIWPAFAPFATSKFRRCLLIINAYQTRFAKVGFFKEVGKTIFEWDKGITNDYRTDSNSNDFFFMYVLRLEVKYMREKNFTTIRVSTVSIENNIKMRQI